MKKIYGVLWLLFIVLFAGILRFARLDQPQVMYFDEVYHAFTAVEYSKQQPAAYDPWARPPEGFAYEWTHPPLAKLAMAASISAFGEHSWAWRLPPVLFGLGSIALTAILAYQLFRSWTVSLLSASFLSVEGLHFVMSRVGMNDSTFLFFFLLTLVLYLAWKEKRTQYWILGCSGIALGLALSAKWTALYTSLIIGSDVLLTWFRQKKLPTLVEFLSLCLSYLIFPVLIYIQTYTQYFSLGYTWTSFVELQKQMWWYHTGLSATHGYQSRPWQWILNLRPVWMYADYSSPPNLKNIYNLGNPVILWSGLAAVAALLTGLRKKWNQNELFLLLAYFALWLPWVLSPRIMFFYHYLPAIPFLVIALALLLRNLLTQKKPALSLVVSGICILSVAWFVIFYPHLSALAAPPELVNTVYFFFPSWR